MKLPLHILMTGGGAPGAAGIIKCLLQDASVQLTVADADENAVSKYLHHRFVQIPKADDLAFTDTLLSLCRQEKIDLILPLVTKELFPLSQHKKRFEEASVRVLVSSNEAIQIANDKARSYQVLSAAGIPVPNFYVANSPEEFIHAAFALQHPKQPFCFKPAVANGSRGFRIVSDSINEADQLFQQKPYNTYITYAHAVKILSSQPFPPLVVTEYLPGNEYSVDCVAEHGKALLVVPRLRQKMINGISVQGRFEKDDIIIDYCNHIIEAIGLHGNIGIQVKQDAKGQSLLLEINPRVQGTIVAALGAGVNLPLLAVKNEMRLSL
ncbi:MAG: ATP-grasp domain-containing protein, partial [Bacteroidota bacterium]|nr:ATP-grasp domain-containing protein [Bacteroidota bacterium]